MLHIPRLDTLPFYIRFEKVIHNVCIQVNKLKNKQKSCISLKLNYSISILKSLFRNEV